MADNHPKKRRAIRSPMSSVKKIRAALMVRGIGVGDVTVSRRLLKEFGMKSNISAKKSRLTKTMTA